jgi:hypothetical protein
MFKTLAPAFAVLLSGNLVSSISLHAMEIQKFDMMSSEDRQAYMDFLPEAAQRLLAEAGRKDDASKVHNLFKEIHPGNVLSDGEIAFEENLDRARVADVKKHAEDPSARRLEVEDALFVTLKKAGVVLPQSFFVVGKDFKPKHPPKEEKR